MNNIFKNSSQKINEKNKIKPIGLKYDSSEIKSNIIFPDFNTRKKRYDKFIEMTKNKKEMNNNKIYLIGFGPIGRLLLYLIIKTIKIDPKNILIVDMRDVSVEAKFFTKMGVNLLNKTKVTKLNYKKIFKDVSKNDIIIDACLEFDSCDMLLLCNEKGASFINSAIQFWEYKDSISYDEIFNKIEKLNRDLKKHNTNFIVSMGCNPGNVNIWIKEGLKQIAKSKKLKNIGDLNKTSAIISEKLGVQVIHISERDTQISKIPKMIGTYSNTWSMNGNSFLEEGLTSAEASWGTHEKYKFKKEDLVKKNDTYLVWKKMGFYVYAQSWVPLYGKYIGNVICHEESFTIGRNLTVYNSDKKIKYKPSVYFIYHACDNAVLSVNELKDHNNIPQNQYRFLSDEIIDGRDILGLTYFLKSGEVFWIGSLLSIHEARHFIDKELIDYINATNLQVCAGYLSGIFYLMELDKNNIKKGLLIPDELPYEKILEWSLPFLGEFIFTKSDFKITLSHSNKFNNKPKQTDDWQFDNFLIGNI